MSFGAQAFLWVWRVIFLATNFVWFVGLVLDTTVLTLYKGFCAVLLPAPYKYSRCKYLMLLQRQVKKEVTREKGTLFNFV